MNKLIAFDTAGPVVGAALLVGDEIFARTERSLRGAETKLVPWMMELLDEAGLQVSDLAGIAVSNGPGAFTGLRVGLSTAIGVSLAAGLPVFPCSSLKSRAARLFNSSDRVLSLLDARKGRVYAALYSNSGELVRAPGDVDPSVAAEWAGAGVIATGEGALVYREVLEAAGLVIAPHAEAVGIESLARLAASALGSNLWVDPGEVSPVYMRPADAQKPRPEKLARLRK
jgi:tRNA threonylcarbamoyladenosine biosynthesis protein TsaB